MKQNSFRIILLLMVMLASGCSPGNKLGTAELTFPTSTKLPTTVPTVALTSSATMTPTTLPVTATAEVIVVTPTEEIKACVDDQATILEGLKKQAQTTFYDKRWPEANVEMKFTLGTAQMSSGSVWMGWAVSTGKTEDRTFDKGGKTYILHIVTVYIVGSKDADLKLVEVPLTYAVTYPDGRTVTALPDGVDQGITSFGHLDTIVVDSSVNNGINWNWCVAGYPTAEGQEFCKFGRTFSASQSDQGKVMTDLVNGIQPHQGWVLMGAWVYSIFGDEPKTVDFQMPSCQP